MQINPSMLSNIPLELRQLHQWVVWRYEATEDGKKPTKRLYNPLTARPASHSDRTTWAGFQAAADAASTGSLWNGIGFVLSDEDPYAFIDLDSYDPKLTDEDRARHKAIYEAFAGYAELSPSGQGIHLIVKGDVPAGRKRLGVEVYSSQRYMTVTGNVCRHGPIVEQDDLLNKLWAELAPANEVVLSNVDRPQNQTDDEVCNAAANAVNGSKFIALWNGQWQSQGYQSQSEADFAMIDILAFFTGNRAQITRIFRASGLGKRPKAARNSYVNMMLNRAFDNQPPQVNIDALQEQIRQVMENPAPQAVEAPAKPIDDVYSVPAGLLGSIARYIYQASPRPVPEIALAAAIGLMSGICGRSYNVSDTGLNQYTMLIAKTGTGKEAMASGIAKLMAEVQKKVPASSEFVGPGSIVSSAALIKYVNKNPSFVAILGEFGATMEQMASPRGMPNIKQLKGEFLNIYGKSGNTDVYRPSIYSNAENSTSMLKSPAFSILAESAPDSFFPHIDERLIVDGLLPRFTIIEYTGLRPDLNKGANVEPPAMLVQQVAELCAHSLMLNSHSAAAQVQLTPEADLLSDKFDRECTKRINDSHMDAVQHIWNRVHLKVLKLSSLVAIGINPFQPVITKEMFEWAVRIVTHSADRLLERFERGEIGSEIGENSQVIEVTKKIGDYIKKDWGYVRKYSDYERMYTDKVVTYMYLNKRLSPMSSFRQDRQGAAAAINKALKVLIDSGVLVEMNKQDVFNRYQVTAKCFAVVNPGYFLKEH